MQWFIHFRITYCKTFSTPISPSYYETYNSTPYEGKESKYVLSKFHMKQMLYVSLNKSGIKPASIHEAFHNNYSRLKPFREDLPENAVWNDTQPSSYKAGYSSVAKQGLW